MLYVVSFYSSEERKKIASKRFHFLLCVVSLGFYFRYKICNMCILFVFGSKGHGA